MAFLGLRVPSEATRLLAGLDISPFGQKVDASEMHVTMCYLGKKVPIERIAQAIAPVFSVVSETTPFAAKASSVTTFPPNPSDGVPIIAPVLSEELHTLRSRVVSVLKSAGVEFSNKYPEYKPHVTLGYGKDPQLDYSRVDQQFAPVTWGVHELVLWGGDRGDNRLLVTFPFSIAGKTASRDRNADLRRAYVQLAQNWPGSLSSMRVAARFQLACEGGVCTCSHECSCDVEETG